MVSDAPSVEGIDRLDPAATNSLHTSLRRYCGENGASMSSPRWTCSPKPCRDDGALATLSPSRSPSNLDGHDPGDGMLAHLEPMGQGTEILPMSQDCLLQLNEQVDSFLHIAPLQAGSAKETGQLVNSEGFSALTPVPLDFESSFHPNLPFFGTWDTNPAYFSQEA